MSTSTRMAWPDVAKGVSILGVLALHVTLAVSGGKDTTLAQINQLLDPLRMPLFFLVTGFFSQKVLNFSFAELVTKRLWFFAVPYVVWVPIELNLKARVYRAIFDTEMPEVRWYIEHLVFGINMAWFLYALILFNVILWVVRSLPAWGALLVSFSPIFILPVHVPTDMVHKLVMYLPVFFIGVHLRPLISQFADRALTPPFLGFTAVLYLGGSTLQKLWKDIAETQGSMEVLWPFYGPETVGVSEMTSLVRLLVHLLLIPVGITGAVAISRIPVASQGLTFLGRYTLPLYIGHPIALWLLYHFTLIRMEWSVSPDAEEWFLRTDLWVGVCMIICFIGGLTLWMLSRVPVLGWLVTPPPISSRLLTGNDRAALKDRARNPEIARR